MPTSKLGSYIIFSLPKAQGSSWKQEQKECEWQVVGITEAVYRDSPTTHINSVAVNPCPRSATDQVAIIQHGERTHQAQSLDEELLVIDGYGMGTINYL